MQGQTGDRAAAAWLAVLVQQSPTSGPQSQRGGWDQNARTGVGGSEGRMGPVNRAMRVFRAALVTPGAAGGCNGPR